MHAAAYSRDAALPERRRKEKSRRGFIGAGVSLNLAIESLGIVSVKDSYGLYSLFGILDTRKNPM
jgi:hypothetical protein